MKDRSRCTGFSLIPAALQHIDLLARSENRGKGKLTEAELLHCKPFMTDGVKKIKGKQLPTLQLN